MVLAKSLVIDIGAEILEAFATPLINLLMNGRPCLIALHTKFNDPISDCNSLSLIN